MSADDMHSCARCATLQKTCCQRAEVIVTQGDEKRIQAATGRIDFSERRPVSNPAYLDHEDDPNWQRWTVAPDGTRQVLKRQDNGDCTFLTSSGCALPLETRPLVCRLYPFTYTERGLEGVNADYCPSAVIPSGKSILQVLDMRQIDGERWRRMLYQELRTKETCDESGTDLRFAG